jgi:hypothetical protein
MQLATWREPAEASAECNDRAFVTILYIPQQRRQIHDDILGGTPAERCCLPADLGEWSAAAVHGNGIQPLDRTESRLLDNANPIQSPVTCHHRLPQRRTRFLNTTSRDPGERVPY